MCRLLFIMNTHIHMLADVLAFQDTRLLRTPATPVWWDGVTPSIGTSADKFRFFPCTTRVSNDASYPRLQGRQVYPFTGTNKQTNILTREIINDKYVYYEKTHSSHTSCKIKQTRCFSRPPSEQLC